MNTVPAYAFSMAPIVPTSLAHAEPLPLPEVRPLRYASNLVNETLLAKVDTQVAAIEAALSRFASVTVQVDPTDLLVDAPGDAVYRDAYVWRRVRPKVRPGKYRAHTEQDPDLWR